MVVEQSDESGWARGLGKGQSSKRAAGQCRTMENRCSRGGEIAQRVVVLLECGE